MAEEKYQIKSEIDHILDRSGMWIGSVMNEIIDYNLYKPSENRIVNVGSCVYNAGLLKLVDEILSNSIDEFRRKDSLFKINNIKVNVTSTGTVTITDNGGISIEKHKQTGILIPELIFGHLRTSSNYDDSQERNVVGVNGLGCKLTNIFSKRFSVHTADGKNEIILTWTNHMRDLSTGKPSKSTKHFTEISFDLDLQRFELEKGLPLSIARIIQKRCIDGAAANPGLTIEFTSDIAEGKLDSTWYFESFKDYVKLYMNPDDYKNMLEYVSPSGRDTVIIIPSLGFDFGFVNGAICSKGTHFKKVKNQITDKILNLCKDKEMELITERDILNRVSVFISTTVVNPTYNSQTKEELTLKLNNVVLSISKKFLDTLDNSEIMNQLIDYYKVKYDAEKKKELRKLNSAIKMTKTKKLIQSTSSNQNLSELWLFEGNSAANGFRTHRDPMTQSAYLLRGKIENSFSLNKREILENTELREIIAAIGLQFNEPKTNIKNCKFSKIIICSDMDQDGHHICGLVIAFFTKHFPELFLANRIFRALSPVVSAFKKNAPKKYYYTEEEYEKEMEAGLLKGYEVLYNKGLGGLATEDYNQMLHNQKLVKFELKDATDIEAVNVWFSKNVEQRKELILIDSEEDVA